MSDEIKNGLKQVNDGMAAYTKAIIDAIEQAKGQQIQAGSETVNTTGNSTTISFPKAFPGKPSVVVSLLSPRQHLDAGHYVHLIDVTEKNFICSHREGNNHRLVINWIATMPTAAGARAKKNGSPAMAKSTPAKAKKR